MEKPNRGKPPLKKIDWKLVDELLHIQCTGEEIAGALNIVYNTLERACLREQKMPYVDYSALKRAGGRSSLRRRQWTTAMEGSPVMQIWLGKQMLGQRDQPEPIANQNTIKIVYERMDAADRDKD